MSLGPGRVARRRGHAALRNRDYLAAEEAFREAATLAPSNAVDWLSLARAEERLCRFDESHASVSKTLELRPRWSQAIWHAAVLLARRGPGNGVAGLLERLGPIERRDRDGLRRTAVLALSAGHHELALRAAELLLRDDPKDEEGLFARAVAELELGREPAARATIESGLGRGGDPALRAAVRFFLHLGETERLREALSRVAVVDADLLVTIGQGLTRRGELKWALDLFERALELEPADERARKWRGKVLGELRVLSGRVSGLATRTQLSTVSGRVLHMVGRSLPQHVVGYTVRTHYVAKAQRSAGLDARAVTQVGFPWNQGVTSASMRELHDGVPYYRLRADGDVPVRIDERLSLNISLVAQLVTELRPAVLHPASDYVNALLALELRRSFGIPVVYEVRGFLEETWLSRQSGLAAAESDQYTGRRDVELRCMREADRVVTLAEVMKEEIVARGVPAGKVTVMPNAVDVEAFVPVGRDDGLAGSLGIGSHELVVGYISSFVGYEGIRYLLEAVAELLERGRPVRAVLVGDGPERASLERLASDLGIAAAVVFTGRIPHEEVLRYYGLIDVFVVPRTAARVSHLVTPLKPFEAMATGRALLVSRVAALEEIVTHGETGLIFEPEDPGSLAGAIESLLDDPGRRQELGAAARDWVCSNRTWQRNGERYRELYDALGVT
jgi:PEP-CTERM/exosortase A-associated glycosyltransferase